MYLQKTIYFSAQILLILMILDNSIQACEINANKDTMLCEESLKDLYSYFNQGNVRYEDTSGVPCNTDHQNHAKDK